MLQISDPIGHDVGCSVEQHVQISRPAMTLRQAQIKCLLDTPRRLAKRIQAHHTTATFQRME